MTADEIAQLRAYALDSQRLHDPAQQGDDAWPNRCAHCHYTRHPCDVYELATVVLLLLPDDDATKPLPQ